MEEFLGTTASPLSLALAAIFILALAAYEAIKALARSQEPASSAASGKRIAAAFAAFFKTLSGSRSEDDDA